MTRTHTTNDDYPTAAEMIAAGYVMENGFWVNDEIRAYMADRDAKEAADAARFAAEMADPDAVWF